MAAVAMAAFGLRAASADWTFSGYMDDQFASGLEGATLAFYQGDTLVTTVESDYGVFAFADSVSVNGGDSWKVVLNAKLSDDGENFTPFSKEYSFTIPSSLVGGGDPADQAALGQLDSDIRYAFVGDMGMLPTKSEAADAGWTGGGSSVPEPTSGLLLLLGVAGLALRRKHA